ncbi:PspA/IM30 family protein [Magnetofaba australis]|uniref:Putative phage shock protein A, PspA n=1 Tax=Magnetofaba australis IT-1 TaxID=1434232 RepID=A0A1Y2K954_9PROT|nr:PspA/IM30 family protein [Magnetofaba australis]OSM07149.1 putative phage shock protein A, PspA [Magnetofaba australis IT-1]
MSGFFQRLFTWGKSEAHAVMDKVEDPAKMAEQGIRELKEDQTRNMESLAQVKAQTVRLRRDVNADKENAANYERKAMLLLQKAQSGQLDPAEADRLAGEALAKRDEANSRANALQTDLQKLDAMTAQLERNVRNIRDQIGKWENELRTLKARAQVSSATKKLNAELAQVDGKGTIAMLERMRDKVNEQESLAQAYGDMAAATTSTDDAIDAALGDDKGASASDSLAALKARMNMQ